jgi:hypothetical protein
MPTTSELACSTATKTIGPAFPDGDRLRHVGSPHFIDLIGTAVTGEMFEALYRWGMTVALSGVDVRKSRRSEIRRGSIKLIHYLQPTERRPVMANQQPTHRAYTVIKREGQDDFWIAIGRVHAPGRRRLQRHPANLAAPQRRPSMQDRPASALRTTRGRNRRKAKRYPTKTNPVLDAGSRPHSAGRLKAAGIPDGSFLSAQRNSQPLNAFWIHPHSSEDHMNTHARVHINEIDVLTWIATAAYLLVLVGAAVLGSGGTMNLTTIEPLAPPTFLPVPEMV